nr:integrase, catalytic region, zinc finger, CCHC-type, peptidase aspartic, catalytic [Tanacetum cinerariifolium]
NALQDLNERFRAKNEKVKQHYKELYDSIKLTRAKSIEKTTSFLDEIKNLKAQLKGKMKCVTFLVEKPKVLAPGMYSIDVEPIPPRNRNYNREVHLYYLKHLTESVVTLHEIVEEARVEKPLDSSLISAYRYTKHYQELLKYMIGTCLKDFSARDKKLASTPFTKKKQVTLREPCETLTHNTPTHPEQQKMKKTNEPVIPSTGVKGATSASGSKPRSNTKKDRTLPAKSAMKKVEDHPRNNKSSVKRKKRVDSSISYKRMWKPIRWKFTLGEQCPLTRFTISKVVHVIQPDNVSTSAIVITERLSNTSQKPLTRTPTEIGDPTYQTLHIRLFSNAGRTYRPLVFGHRDVNGVDLIKGNHGTNLYTISVEDMMKSFPICLLSKASKNKSWLWHRRLNHLNFVTINDLARKDLVRGLPRLKIEKDHL